MKTKHRIAIRDENEARVIKAIETGAMILNEKLGISPTLQVERQTGWAGNRAFHAGKYVPRDNLVAINLRNLYGASLVNIITVLGHEYRHAIQSLTDWRFDNRLSTNFRKSHKSAYYNRPVEIDARAFQDEYAKLVLTDARFSEYIDIEKMPGSTPMKIDWDASYLAVQSSEQDLQLFLHKDKSTSYMRLVDLPVSEFKTPPTRWTKKACSIAWANKHLMKPWSPVMVPVTLEDLVS
jgi:hypothetical protein